MGTGYCELRRRASLSLSLIQRGDINAPCKWAESTFIGRKSETISAAKNGGVQVSRDACEKKERCVGIRRLPSFSPPLFFFVTIKELPCINKIIEFLF